MVPHRRQKWALKSLEIFCCSSVISRWRIAQERAADSFGELLRAASHFIRHRYLRRKSPLAAQQLQPRMSDSGRSFRTRFEPKDPQLVIHIAALVARHQTFVQAAKQRWPAKYRSPTTHVWGCSPELMERRFPPAARRDSREGSPRSGRRRLLHPNPVRCQRHGPSLRRPARGRHPVLAFGSESRAGCV